MNIRLAAAALLAAILLGASHPARLALYSAPAGNRPAGASPRDPTDAVLPNGRIASPAGARVFVGTDPLAVALTPDDRFAIVANAAERPGRVAPIAGSPVVPGYSLAVVATRSMRVVSVYQAPGVHFFTGVAAVADPQNPRQTLVLASNDANDSLRVFDLDASGQLTAEPHSIALGKKGFPASITISPNGRVAYVANMRTDALDAIDIASRSLRGSTPVGYDPACVAVTARTAYVTNGGFAQYPPLARQIAVPPFAQPAVDPYRSSSLSVLALSSNDALPRSLAGTSIVRMDPIPNGVNIVGGIHPDAIAARRDGRFAYVALPNVDRLAIVELKSPARVVNGLDLRLFPTAPYGTQPSAVAISPDGTRIYVALAGLDAVAVLDAHNPIRLQRLGLIPTGWYPSALALSKNGRFLYVTNAKGVDGWGMLQRIDTKKINLMKTTLSALRYQRRVSLAKPNAVVPPLRSRKRSSVIDHIVYISLTGGTYDAMLGDLSNSDDTPHGNGESALALYTNDVTPNLHALALRYALADNFYADDADADINRQFALGGIATLNTQRMLAVTDEMAPMAAHGDDPENYPRAGYLFNALARARLSFRDYGALLQLSGYRPDVKSSRGLGGTYSLDMPALATLAGNVDLQYPGWNLNISDASRADEFVRDMSARVRDGREPDFSYIWLPSGSDRASISDADRALGRIVAYISQTPSWSTTAIFIVPDGVFRSTDHVNGARSYALVVSPHARPGYIGEAHLSVASVVKTEEEVMGLPPLSLNDFLATDMSEFFTLTSHPATYTALR